MSKKTPVSFRIDSDIAGAIRDSAGELGISQADVVELGFLAAYYFGVYEALDDSGMDKSGYRYLLQAAGAGGHVADSVRMYIGAV